MYNNILLEFEMLRTKHRKTVRWQVSHGRYGLKWSFHSFARLPGSVPGDGARALTEVCALADKFGIALALWCIVELIPYYAEFGFACREGECLVHSPILKRPAARIPSPYYHQSGAAANGLGLRN